MVLCDVRGFSGVPSIGLAVISVIAVISRERDTNLPRAVVRLISMLFFPMTDCAYNLFVCLFGKRRDYICFPLLSKQNIVSMINIANIIADIFTHRESF